MTTVAIVVVVVVVVAEVAVAVAAVSVIKFPEVRGRHLLHCCSLGRVKMLSKSYIHRQGNTPVPCKI